MYGTDTCVQAWADVSGSTEVEYLASRDRDVEFTIGGRQSGIVLTFTEDAVKKFVATCNAALDELREKFGPADNG